MDATVCEKKEKERKKEKKDQGSRLEFYRTNQRSSIRVSEYLIITRFGIKIREFLEFKKNQEKSDFDGFGCLSCFEVM